MVAASRWRADDRSAVPAIIALKRHDKKATLMPSWLDLNWHRMFAPSEPVLEIVIRGSCMYLALFALLRLFRRQTGSIGPADLLVLLLIADAAQNGMAGDYKSITDGVILVSTIVLWEYVLDWLGFHSRWLRPVLERSPLRLVENGQPRHENLRSELMSVDDLMAHLRQKGVEDLSQVKACFLEGDGHVSVITLPNGIAQQDDEPVQH